MKKYKNLIFATLVGLLIGALVFVLVVMNMESNNSTETESKGKSAKALDVIIENCSGVVGISATIPFGVLDSPKLSVTCSEVKPEFIEMIKNNIN